MFCAAASPSTAIDRSAMQNQTEDEQNDERQDENTKTCQKNIYHHSYVLFPSSQRRGGCAIKRMPRSHRSGADGVVSLAKRCSGLTTPSAPSLRCGAATPPL